MPIATPHRDWEGRPGVGRAELSSASLVPSHGHPLSGSFGVDAGEMLGERRGDAGGMLEGCWGMLSCLTRALERLHGAWQPPREQGGDQQRARLCRSFYSAQSSR